MIRKESAVAGLLACWLVGLHVSAGPAAAAEKAAAKKAGFVHTVIFYLKKDVAPGEIDAVIADARKLKKIPSVRGLEIGRPAEKGTPELAQKDFQVGLLVLFDNDEGLQEYINHPLHKQYVEKHLQQMDKVLVYDFVDQAR